MIYPNVIDVIYGFVEQEKNLGSRTVSKKASIYGLQIQCESAKQSQPIYASSTHLCLLLFQVIQVST